LVQGQFERAATFFERAAELRPEDYQAPALLINPLGSLGRREEALAATRRVVAVIERHLELNPEDPRALCLGAAALATLGDRERSLEWAERAQEIDPGDPAVLYNVACMYTRLNEPDKAADCLAEAVRNGFSHREWIENDSQLDLIRDHPRYKEVMKQLE
jgi:Flp pilus assembly protein TadD